GAFGNCYKRTITAPFGRGTQYAGEVPARGQIHRPPSRQRPAVVESKQGSEGNTMTLEGIVQNGIVVLEKGASIPNGTHVQVVLPAATEQPSANGDPSGAPFIGMWKDRQDLTD